MIGAEVVRPVGAPGNGTEVPALGHLCPCGCGSSRKEMSMTRFVEALPRTGFQSRFLLQSWVALWVGPIKQDSLRRKSEAVLFWCLPRISCAARGGAGLCNGPF